MTKRNTYIVTAIVVACVVAGVVVYANWDSLRTAITGAPGVALGINKTPTTQKLTVQELKSGKIAWFQFDRTVPAGGATDFLFVDGYGWVPQGASNLEDDHIDKIWFDAAGEDHGDAKAISARDPSQCTGVSGLWGICLLDYDQIYTGQQDGYLDSLLAYNSNVPTGRATFWVGIQFKPDTPVGTLFENWVGVTDWEMNKTNAMFKPCTEGEGPGSCWAKWRAALNFADLNEFQKWQEFTWTYSHAQVEIVSGTPGDLTPTPASTVSPPGTGQATMTKAVSPSRVSPGGEVTYSLVVKNAGTAPLNEVIVEDDYDEGAFSSIHGISNGGVDRAGVIIWNLGSLVGNQSVTLTYKATVKSDLLAMTVRNEAICRVGSTTAASASAELTVTTGPTPTPTITQVPTVTVVPTPTQVEPAGPHATLDKTVAKILGGVSTPGGVSQSGTGVSEAGTGVSGTGGLSQSGSGLSATGGLSETGGLETTTMTAAPGDKVQYTISLTNDGNQDLHNMRVYDKFAATYLENITIVKGQPCPASEGTVDQACFQVGDLPRGALTITLEYTATVKSDVPNNTEVVNDANCRYDELSSVSGCHDSVMFKVARAVEPSTNYEIWVTKDINLSSAKKGERLNYTTKAGNKGSGAANHIWLIDSLLFAHNGEVQLPQLQQAAGRLSDTSTIDDVRTILEQTLGIEETGGLSATGGVSQSGNGISTTGGLSQSGNGLSATGGISQTGTTIESNRVVKPDGTVVYYNNKPGDDATTGLKLSNLSAAGGLSAAITILDLDRDGIKDTIIHQKNQTWAGTSSGPATVHTVRPYTSVRSDLSVGEYRIVNTGVVIKADTHEVYNDPAATTVTVSAPVEAAPAIGVTKTVSDTDESNKTANTATAGEAMTYTVAYTNTGAGTARGAYIEDDYDERYIKISDNGGAQDSGSALLWTLGNVAAGQTVTKTFKVTINSDLAEVGATIKNIGIAGAQNQTEKTAETTTTVPVKTNPTDQPYLVISKSVVNENGGTVDPGDVLRYTVTIENRGKAAATNASLEDTLSTHLENLKVITIPTGAKDESTSTKIKITGFTVNAGASVQIVYTASVKMGTANGTKISNDVVVTYGTSGGTTGGRSSGTATGQVGSAFTGPGTGAAEANALEAGAAKAAQTGANPLTTAMVVIGLAIAAGIVAVILRKRALVS